jgi:peptidoglycan-associated lipoprotein
MTTARRLALSTLALLTVGVAACRRNRPAAPQPVPAADDPDAERARREAEAREAARRAEEERLRAEREAAERARAAAQAALEAAIYFGFDRSDLDAEARRTLDAKLPALHANPTLRIRIAGHTDEQGSDEYNLALGQRRAAAAKRYLSQREIDADRIEIVSFGEEQPACMAREESCWARNRRDEFAVTVGAIGATGTAEPAPR